MSEHVISTKLFAPPARPGRIARRRLVDRLVAGLRQGQRLTLISAPAGFGKTSLAIDWIGALDGHRRVAWLSLDEGDNDLAQFLHGLIAALQTAAPDIGKPVLSMLRAARLPPLPELLGPLVNRLANADLSLLLVLDDFHLIVDGAVHEAVRFLASHQPPNLHTAILSREDPPLPLPRLRARGQMTEIRERDLRFNADEAHAFLTQTMGLRVGADMAATLAARTEGWVAGLQLAALALQEVVGPDETQAFVADFAGSDRLVADYLIAEVLQRLPGPVRDFLLRTSILERLCAPLCDAIVKADPVDDRGAGGGRFPSGAEEDLPAPAAALQPSSVILQALDHANLFLIPLDNQRIWYRYHHLFRDFLRVHLRDIHPDLAPQLHRRASEWFEMRGLVREAVSHALETRDWPYAAGLVERHAMQMLGSSQVGVVRAWCEAIPEAVLRARPGLCVFYAWSLVLLFRSDYVERIEVRLQQADEAARAPGSPKRARLGEGGAWVPQRQWTAGHLATLRSQVLLSRPDGLADPQALIQLSRRALELLPATEKTARSVSTIDLAHAYMAMSQPALAEAAFDEALRRAQQAGNGYSAVTVVFYLVRLAHLRGDLRRAAELCEWGRALLNADPAYAALDLPAARGVDVAQSGLLLEQNDLAGAEQALALSLDIMGWASWMEIIGYANLARLCEFRRDTAGALAALGRMEKLGPQFTACAQALGWRYRLLADAPDARLLTEAADWAARQAAGWGDGRPVPGLGPLQCDLDYLTRWAWCHVQVTLGQPEAALRLIEPALAVAEQQGLNSRVVELSVLVALAHDARGQASLVRAVLIRALALAAGAGLIRVFDQGPRVPRLLAQLAGGSVASEYAARIVAVLGRSPQSAGSVLPRPGELIDPITERELQVLRLIAGGLSNADIGAALVIAPATVKRHINSLYSKLAVHSRTQALDKARKLRLLE
jgi:LuxR family maltose regulon positive regulatory protein